MELRPAEFASFKGSAGSLPAQAGCQPAVPLAPPLGPVARVISRLVYNALHRYTLQHMKFPTVIDRDEDGMWVVECPAIPGCVSQGQTREEAMENIKEAIALCLEVRAERGMPFTFETSQVEVAV